MNKNIVFSLKCDCAKLAVIFGRCKFFVVFCVWARVCQRLPANMNSMPSSTISRSMALARKLRSLK